jgi:membrane protease YdiL (CAAX protease family)
MDEVKPTSEIASESASAHDAGQSTPFLPSQSAASPTQPAQTIFVGPHGIRTPWRFLLYVVIAAAIFLALVVFTRALFSHHHLPSILIGLITEFDLLVAATGSALVMARIEKRPFGAYGLPRSGAFGKMFWIGSLWGFAAISLLILSLRGAGVFSFGSFALHGTRVFKFALFWGVFFLLVGLFEEFLIRGYTQFTLARAIGFWPTAFLMSLIFGAIHLGNPGEAWIGGLAAGLIGLFFCLTLYRTGALWFAVGFHAAWDWGESYFYSVADSGGISPGHLLNSSFHGSRWLTGGSVGPEGSLLVFAIIALVWIAFSRLYPKVNYVNERE